MTEKRLEAEPSVSPALYKAALDCELVGLKPPAQAFAGYGRRDWHLGAGNHRVCPPFPCSAARGALRDGHRLQHSIAAGLQLHCRTCWDESWEHPRPRRRLAVFLFPGLVPASRHAG